jgi:hypothetical protein
MSPKLKKENVLSCIAPSKIRILDDQFYPWKILVSNQDKKLRIKDFSVKIRNMIEISDTEDIADATIKKGLLL